MIKFHINRDVRGPVPQGVQSVQSAVTKIPGVGLVTISRPLIPGDDWKVIIVMKHDSTAPALAHAQVIVSFPETCDLVAVYQLAARGIEELCNEVAKENQK